MPEIQKFHGLMSRFDGFIEEQRLANGNQGLDNIQINKFYTALVSTLNKEDQTVIPRINQRLERMRAVEDAEFFKQTTPRSSRATSATSVHSDEEEILLS